MKRFWDAAEVAPETGGFGVRLDGRPLRIPAGPALILPNAALAEAVAEEWQQAGAQSRVMDYADVPLTRIAGTAQVRVALDPAASVAAIAAYGESDLLCYRASTPPALAARQEAAWQPWLDWARLDLGAALTTTTGIIHVGQHPEALAALRRAVAAHGPWMLAGLGLAVPALGSVVLGLALAAGRLDAGRAHALSLTDELFQEEQWGEDADAATRRTHVAADIADAARFMALLR